MRRPIFVALLALASACVTTHLSPEGERVRVTTNAEAVRGCKLLGNIEASDRMNGGMMGQMAAEENANRRLRNDAAKLGANVVLMASSTTGMSGSRARGEAYACSESH
jgi:uncharacterized protein YbjQ (UPF0145 family)